MPISGVMSETLEREGGSIRGEEDFFSVASTMPFVAREVVNIPNVSGVQMRCRWYL